MCTYKVLSYCRRSPTKCYPFAIAFSQIASSFLTSAILLRAFLDKYYCKCFLTTCYPIACVFLPSAILLRLPSHKVLSFLGCFLTKCYPIVGVFLKVLSYCECFLTKCYPTYCVCFLDMCYPFASAILCIEDYVGTRAAIYFLI